MTTETAHAMGLRVQITGPDLCGNNDLVGLAATILAHNPHTGSYFVGFYLADVRRLGSRYFPPESIELIDVN